MTAGSGVGADGFKMPPDSQRCPSRWGPGDERGSANWMSPAQVIRATQLIHTGEFFELGDGLSSDPNVSFVLGSRSFKLYTKPAPPKPDQRVAQEERVVAELGQLGTQLDALSHQMWGDSFYNCFKYNDIFTPTGFRKLGVENVGFLMTRAVLIDVAGLKGVDILPAGYVITPEDLQQALSRNNLALEPGDAVLINTGYGRLLGSDHTRYAKASAGVGVAAGRWLVTKEPMLVGADNCCVEVIPSEPGMSLPVHSLMLIENGILLLENLKLEQLVAAKAHETAFVLQPMKMRGATGSAVAPVAVR